MKAYFDLSTVLQFYLTFEEQNYLWTSSDNCHLLIYFLQSSRLTSIGISRAGWSTCQGNCFFSFKTKTIFIGVLKSEFWFNVILGLIITKYKAINVKVNLNDFTFIADNHSLIITVYYFQFQNYELLIRFFCIFELWFIFSDNLKYFYLDIQSKAGSYFYVYVDCLSFQLVHFMIGIFTKDKRQIANWPNPTSTKEHIQLYPKQEQQKQQQQRHNHSRRSKQRKYICL
jgi:hypothetical protein